ncbi:MAG: serine hydroxymethyltransferase, partial [Parcubacteria group bacterium]|nr:serine hydroxymethyltransferase [Parcubacteria group bacterium]
SPVTYMAKLFKFVRYGMKNPDTGEIDYDEMLETAKRERPKIVLAGFSGYPRELDWERIANIAREVDAVAMADVAHIAGLIAGGAAKNPFDYGFNIVTTTTHKTLRGPRGGMILSKGTVSTPLRAPEKTIENLPTLIDRSIFPGFQGGPHMHQIAAKAVALHEAAQPSFSTYAHQVVANAKAMAEVFTAGGVRLITGGTDNHLLLADVFGSLGISGGDAETLLDRAGMTLNKNSIANDTRTPFDPSGIRFGTPAMTTRGFKEEQSKEVAQLMLEVLDKRDDATVETVGKRIKEMAAAFPIPESFA